MSPWLLLQHIGNLGRERRQRGLPEIYILFLQLPPRVWPGTFTRHWDVVSSTGRLNWILVVSLLSYLLVFQHQHTKQPDFCCCCCCCCWYFLQWVSTASSTAQAVLLVSTASTTNNHGIGTSNTRRSSRILQVLDYWLPGAVVPPHLIHGASCLKLLGLF